MSTRDKRLYLLAAALLVLPHLLVWWMEAGA